METNQKHTWVKKFRILTLSLIFSGALNIGLLATLISLHLQQRNNPLDIPMPFHSERKIETTNTHVLTFMKGKSFRELVSFLTNRDLIEEGYAKRDFALAALIAYHHFNLERALSGLPSQKRVIQISESEKVDIFPGLTEDQFQAIIRFAYQEKWPITSKGLFNLLQKWEGPIDETLKQAFAVTPEFYSLQVLFQKTEAPQQAEMLLQLVREGNWDFLERFSCEMAQVLDLTVEKRRRLLLSYLALRSPTAAQLLLTTDFQFVLKRLEDQGILDLLELLQAQTKEVEAFCKELLRSSRGDQVWKTAAARLTAFGVEVPSPVMKPQAVAIRPAPQPEKKAVEELPPALSFYQHTVKEGESLWKIARQYKVKVDELSRLNELEKDQIFPGMMLRIPQELSPSQN